MSVNPKRTKSLLPGRSEWYPYYAGYSLEFVNSCLTTVTRDDVTIFDPWCGSGTTVQVAYEKGLHGIGIDINPAMVVVSNARLLCGKSLPSLMPLAQEITARTSIYKLESPQNNDALLQWFTPKATSRLRNLQKAIQKLLINPETTKHNTLAENCDKLSDLASFFLVCLFRTARTLARGHRTSNPTWTKSTAKANRVAPTTTKIKTAFIGELTSMIDNFNFQFSCPIRSISCTNNILLGDSQSIKLPTSSIDMIVTSPPYCTRIDYAYSTRIELAILGLNDHGFRLLREETIGSTVIRNNAAQEVPSTEANKVVKMIRDHHSKGASNYYAKQYAEYFTMISNSITEISRVTKKHGQVIFVVQDSFFKGRIIDLSKICTQLFNNAEFTLETRKDWPVSTNLVNINSKARKYIKNTDTATESVLHYRKVS